jgi:hypothetical protein
VEGWRAEQQRQQTNAWSPGQKILNDTGARQPEHTFHQPVPIVAHIVWADTARKPLCRVLVVAVVWPVDSQRSALPVSRLF